MDHTHIVHAGDLDRYAPTRESEAVIPELVYWLVKQSARKLTVCRIPYGEAVNQPGWDGLVQVDEAFLEFIPEGKSYWEIGTGAEPQSKATDDFRKRTESIADAERAESSFVFVTPRSSGSGGWNEPEQSKWIERRKDRGWKLIRVIDGVKLADWLREFPAVGRWMAKRLNLSRSLGGLSTAAEHWQNLIEETTSTDPPFPPKLFTVGRDNACEALQAAFEGKTQLLLLFAESPQDVTDFVSAFLAGLDTETSRSYGNRCLFISDEEAWRSVVETHSSNVLVADPRLGLETEEGAMLQTIARRKGHGIIVPLCGAWSGNSPEILKLRSPSPSQIETVLRDAKYPDIRAKELARIGGDRISALRRHLRGYGTVPPYATWENAKLIAQAGLAGQWDGANPTDRAALEMLLGKDYGEWIETLRSDALRSDSPLVQNNEKWRFVARGEAWNFLGHRIADDDLARFQETAVTVLKERNPKFDLPKEDRFAAGIHGKVLAHSNQIRKGIAETLALIGSRSKALSSCSEGRAESTAILAVRRLLNEANWDIWASLDSLLPMLAEAAPSEFLNAVESVLGDLETTPFHRVFAEEGGGGLGGWNYMSGLLWALESLAWNPDYLSRVSIILADIASIDPGGNWSNRPSNSLTDIFLPWHVQTTASFERRKAVVEAVIREHPEVGWKFLLSLLPHSHGVTSGSHQPTWREFIPRDWKSGVSVRDYWEQITAFTELALSLAKKDADKLIELINRLPDIPAQAHDSLLKHLCSEEITSLPEAARLPLWEKLKDLVRQHRRYSNADWALPEDAINQIEEAANILAPQAPELKYHYLFSGRDFDLFDESQNYEEQRTRLDEVRQAAVQQILNLGGLESVLAFADRVSAPYEVGRALGGIPAENLENGILPSHLNTPSETLRRVVAGFIWARYWRMKWPWVDQVTSGDWTAEEKAKFFSLLPFEEEVWKRVGVQLGTEEGFYWRNVNINPYGPDRELTVAIEKLLEYGRPAAAVLCVAQTKDDKNRFSPQLATRALLSVLETPSEGRHLDQHSTVELIAHLQDFPDADQDALFRIEWNFLPWLGRFSSGSPATLEKRLSSHPTFFAELIALVYRSKDRDEQKAEPDEQRRNLARNAYTLLSEWDRCPGLRDDGSLDTNAFHSWINEARRITEESGHTEVAQIQIGQLLVYAPKDPNGLWIHEAVASILNNRDTGDMRSGFTTELFNQRGTHGFTHGRDERKLAEQNREKAEALDAKGYTRFASAMREFARHYERDAEREAKRDPFED